MSLTVDPRTDPAWRQLMRTPCGSLFGSPGWLAAISDTYGFDITARLTVDDDGTPKTGLAFAQIDDFLGARQVSVPFCDYLDPVVNRDDEWHDLVDPLLERDLPLQLRVLDADVPRRDPRFVTVEEMAWHATTLVRDDDELFSALDPQSRQNVRAARRHGVTVRFGSDLEDVRAFHDLHRRTRKHKYRLLAQPVSFFENIWKHFAPADNIVVGFAEHEGDVIAGALYLVWSDVWYYKFGASILERSVVRPNELLAWESMLVGKQRGCTTYNWGVSDLDQPGLVAYKRKFATEERRVSVLRRIPTGYTNRVAAEALPVLGELTGLLTRDDVPDDITQRAGEILYRYFT
jgi:CelD/BcsL family acetyltransferase involved in cellulose biosynthesis